ncbi:hypothetical protein AAT19DRAFT_14569 [Rhodotorula toruloides]|uniref:Uncharacterized protein n=1 Tax=Rhodotorula toruloides TaxID=5286 RepID=A0A2T0A8I4_RHOTO|nr:hypothetical protein AAT19DRAFT_14569 [Rhodotorula toruloides]
MRRRRGWVMELATAWASSLEACKACLKPCCPRPVIPAPLVRCETRSTHTLSPPSCVGTPPPTTSERGLTGRRARHTLEQALARPAASVRSSRVELGRARGGAARVERRVWVSRSRYDKRATRRDGENSSRIWVIRVASLAGMKPFVPANLSLCPPVAW